jgi:hypothetical protein
LKGARLPVVLAEIERGNGGSAHGRDSYFRMNVTGTLSLARISKQR